MKKSELIKIIKEEIYRLTPTSIDNKTEVLRKALQKYQIDLNKLPKEIINGALDAMDSYKDIQTVTNNLDTNEKVKDI